MVKPLGGVAQGQPPVPPPGRSVTKIEDSNPASLKDSLGSMAFSAGKGCAKGLFSIVVFLFTKSAHLIASYWKKSPEPQSSPSHQPSPTKKYNLGKPDHLRKAFRKNPQKVFKALQGFLSDKIELAEKILLNLAKDWKEHPDKYLNYDRVQAKNWVHKDESKREKSRAIRTNAVAAFEELFAQFILTQELLDFRVKISLGELSNSEIQIMSGDKVTEETKELTEFRNQYAALKELDKKKEAFWDHIYVFLLDEKNEFFFKFLRLNLEREHLNYTGTTMALNAQGISFGMFVERILYFCNFSTLHYDEQYKTAEKFLIKLLKNLDFSKKPDGTPFLDNYPVIQELIQLLIPLLERKSDQIHGIVKKILEEIAHMEKSLPRRK